MFPSDEGTTYGSTFGDQLPWNSPLVSDVLLSALEAECLAIKEAIQAASEEPALHVTCLIAQGHMGLSFNVDTWRRGGCVYTNGSTIPRAATLRDTCEIPDAWEKLVNCATLGMG